MLDSLVRLLRPKPVSPLRAELTNLERRIASINLYLYDLEQDFWASGGVCCAGCGVREFNDLLQKQERLQQRANQIKDKLKRDS